MHWPEYQAALAAFRPDQVILVFGSNDSPSSSLQQAMRTFKASAPKVFYAGPPRYDSVSESQALSAGIRDLAKQVFGDKHLDAWPYTGPSTPRAADGLHFTPSGGATWAEGMVRQWAAATTEGGGLPVWVGPAILGGAALVALSAYFVNRSRL
jgi:lysophospholipase L1-like esterase